MVTATKRRIGRDAQAKLKKELGKASKRNAKAASLETIKRDRDVLANNAAYEARERGAESMVMWVTGVVKLFANPKKNFGVSDDVARYFTKEEARIRSMTRRDKMLKVSARDKTGVSASQFKGVLIMAKMSGGAAMWERITNIASNWSLSRELAAQVRAYHKAESKWPNDAWLDRKLAANKSSKRGGKGKAANKGGIKLGGPALAARMLKDAKDFKSRLGKLMRDAACEVPVQAMLKNAALIVTRVKAHVAKMERDEKAAA